MAPPVDFGVLLVGTPAEASCKVELSLNSPGYPGLSPVEDADAVEIAHIDGTFVVAVLDFAVVGPV